MAIDSYVVFIPYTGAPLLSESQVDMSLNKEELATDLTSYATASQLFEVEDYSFDIEQAEHRQPELGRGRGQSCVQPVLDHPQD